MPRWADFWLRLAAAVLAALVVAPVLGPYFPETPFHRLLTRVFQVTLVIALVAGAGHPRTWVAKVQGMGLRGPDRFRRFWAGAAAAFVLLAFLYAVSLLLGGRSWLVRPYHTPLGPHLASSIVAAVVVSYFEELLFRGYLKDVLGNLWSVLLFAGVHYIQPLPKDPLPRSAPAGPDYDPLLGVKRLGELFEAWGDLRNATFGVVSLALFGLALNRLRERTGTLYVGMGVHAALVFALAFVRRYVSSVPTGDPWIYGGGRLHDGLLGTIMLGVLVFLAYRMPLSRRLRNT